MFRSDLMKEARERGKITQEALGNAIGKSKWTVIRMEKGTLIPSVNEVEQIAAILSVSTDYLLGREDEKSALAIADKGARRIDTDLIYVPVLSREMTACCGTGIPSTEITSEPEECVPVPRSSFRALDDLRPPFAIYVEGDCLESAGIQDGDKVIINPAEMPPQGTIALVRMHGMNSLKYLYHLKNNEVLLQSDTDDYTLTPEEMEDCDFAIIGAVVAIHRPRPRARPLFRRQTKK